MWKLQVYVIRQLAGAFAVATAAMLFVAIPGITVSAVTKLAGAGTIVVLNYIPLIIASFVPFVLPVSFLIALVGTYGRLAADNEWVSIRMAGISPYRMLLPALALGSLLAPAIYAVNAEILPILRHREQAYRVNVLRDVAKSLSPGRTDLYVGDFYLTARHRDVKTGTFYEVVVDMSSQAGDGERQTILADSMLLRFTDDFLIIDVEGMLTENSEGSVAMDTASISIPIEDLFPVETDSYKSRRYKTTSQLLQALEDPKLKPRAARKIRYDLHERITNAVITFVFVLLGVPTGILIRRGTMLFAFATAIGFASLYWIVSFRLGAELSSSGALEPWICAWGPLALFGLGGAILTWRAFRR